LQAEYRINAEKDGRERQKSLWEIVKRLWEFVRLNWHMGSTPAQNRYSTPTLYTNLTVSTSVGRFSLLWEPAGSGSYMMYWEPDRFFESLYMCVCVCLGWWEPIKFSRFFFFSKLTRFSNMAILAYVITVDFPNRFSQPGSHTFWKLIFILIFIYLFILTKIIFFP
jgi:hypothetical protein